jgi:hypothetical protein
MLCITDIGGNFSTISTILTAVFDSNGLCEFAVIVITLFCILVVKPEASKLLTSNSVAGHHQNPSSSCLLPARFLAHILATLAAFQIQIFQQISAQNVPMYHCIQKETELFT